VSPKEINFQTEVGTAYAGAIQAAEKRLISAETNEERTSGPKGQMILVGLGTG
jgi:hypothetical protein